MAAVIKCLGCHVLHAIESTHGERSEGGTVDGDGNGVGTEGKGAVRCSGGQVRVRARLCDALFLFVTTTHVARAHRSVVQRPTDCPIRNRMADATDPRATPSPLIDAVTRGGGQDAWAVVFGSAEPNGTVCLARRVCRTDRHCRGMRCGGTKMCSGVGSMSSMRIGCRNWSPGVVVDCIV